MSDYREDFGCHEAVNIIPQLIDLLSAVYPSFPKVITVHPEVYDLIVDCIDSNFNTYLGYPLVVSGAINMVRVEVIDPNCRKELNIEVLEKATPELEPGAWCVGRLAVEDYDEETDNYEEPGDDDIPF